MVAGYLSAGTTELTPILNLGSDGGAEVRLTVNSSSASNRASMSCWLGLKCGSNLGSRKTLSLFRAFLDDCIPQSLGVWVSKPSKAKMVDRLY